MVYAVLFLCDLLHFPSMETIIGGSIRREYAGPVKNILSLKLYEMTSFTSKSEQKKEQKKDECSHRSRKESRSCTLAKETWLNLSEHCWEVISGMIRKMIRDALFFDEL